LALFRVALTQLPPFYRLQPSLWQDKIWNYCSLQCGKNGKKSNEMLLNLLHNFTNILVLRVKIWRSLLLVDVMFMDSLANLGPFFPESGLLV